jgi:uncharacterized protein YacL (UPF0231 family)
LPYSSYKDKEQYKSFISNSYMYLAIYILLVILIQFMVNSSIITSNCGGNITENMGAAGVLTFVPWILIFGVLVLILTIYPGFKSAFSDVVGYYYVSTTASKLLTELLVNTDIEKKMADDATMTEEKKLALESAADTIIKICGNTSILINQIVPSNFQEYWSILTPLMKDKYQKGGPEADKMQNDLFEIEGAKGRISFHLYGHEATVYKDGKAEIITFNHPKYVQQPMIEQVVQYFLGKATNPCPAADAIESMRIMENFVYGG